MRLPGLFGPGLKKNLVFDLLHQPHERFAHSDSTFQFYDVRDLWGHVLQAQNAGLSLVHLTTEPLSAADVGEGGVRGRLPVSRTAHGWTTTCAQGTRRTWPDEKGPYLRYARGGPGLHPRLGRR